MVDLDELERLRTAAKSSTSMMDTAAFIFSISHACDDGLLERLREAERKLALLSDPEVVRVNIMRGTIAKPDDLVFLHDTNGPVAALKAENERLRTTLLEAREDILNYKNARWSEAEGTDDDAVGYIDAALETTNG